MNNPEAPKTHQENKGEGWDRLHKITAIGGAVFALSTVGAGIWKHFDKSGEVEGYTPEHPVPAAIDNRLNIGSWNMHHETASRVDQIAKVIRRGHLDAMALQEVSGDDLDNLEDRLPGWYSRPVVTDTKSKPQDGGSYNVILSRQRPEDIRTRSLDGTSLLKSAVGTITGLGTDVAHADTSLKRTWDGRQEKRAAISEKIKVGLGQQPEFKDVVFITSHISGDSRVHNQQREELMDFIKDNKNNNRPVIFCGDLNGGPEEVIPRFAELGFITPETKYTSTSDKTIDYCSYYEGGVLGLGKVAVLANPKTDHHPIIASWTIHDD